MRVRVNVSAYEAKQREFEVWVTTVLVFVGD